jgi:site-specific DNA-cytosine methylase
MGFDKEDAVVIENVQKLLNDNNLELNLTLIKANYGNLAKYITKLETSGLLLVDEINIIVQVQN